MTWGAKIACVREMDARYSLSCLPDSRVGTSTRCRAVAERLLSLENDFHRHLTWECYIRMAGFPIYFFMINGAAHGVP